MNFIAWLIFIGAAVLEVGGDVVIRHGLRGHKLALVITGFLTLGGYGLLVNMVKWDFSRLLGTYVGVFALVSILFGKFFMHENIPTSTWLGLGIIIAGCLVIQSGQS